MQANDLPGFQMLARLFAVLLLAPILLPLASAAPDPTAPGVREWVVARLTLDQPDLTRYEISGEILVHKHPVGERTYSAAMMSRQYRGLTSFDEGSGDEFVARLEGNVRAGLEETLAAAFPTAERSITRVDADEANLALDRAEAYDPPVRVAFEATIVRSRADVGLGDIGDDAVDAVLAAGGRLRSTLRLTAEPGHDLVFTIRPPAAHPTARFSQLSAGVVEPDGSAVVVRVENAAGGGTLVRESAVVLLDPGANAPVAEDIETTVDVRLGALRPGAAEIAVEADVLASLRAIDVATRFPGALPAAVDLEFLSADALRALRRSGAVSDDDLAAADAAFLGRIGADLAALLGGDATATGGLDRADLQRAPATPFSTTPGAPFAATATGAYPLPGEHAANADLALAIGGTIRVGLTLSGGSGGTTYRIHPPPGLQLFEPEGGTVTADGLTATFEVPAGESAEVGMGLRQTGVRLHDAEVAEVGVVVDLHDIEVTVGQAMGGDFGTLLADVRVTGKLGVVAVPESVRASLGGSLDLSHVTSDGVRLLLDRGLLSRATLDELEAAMLETVRSSVSSALGADVVVTGGLRDDTLSTDLVGSPPSADVPILFEAQASFARPLSAPAEATIALYSLPQTFTFPRVRDLDTTYTVVLPRGLAVTSLDATAGETETAEWSDGRQAFVVRPAGDASTVNVTMAVTPGFVLLKFWPLVLGALVVLVLLVGTPVALVVLKRRKA